jgi:hypothetical protein
LASVEYWQGKALPKHIERVADSEGLSVLPHCTAIRFGRKMSCGKTAPFSATCVVTQGAPGWNVGSEVDVVIKASNGRQMRPEQFLAEAYGNALAQTLGVLAPEACLVELTSSFLSAAEANGQLPLGYSCGGAVGTAQILPGLSPWVKGSKLRAVEVSAAADLYAFDQLTYNIDRTHDHPNCGRQAGRLVAFDFEMCFGQTLPPPPQIWEVTNLSPHWAHLFRTALKGRNPSFQAFLHKLSGISDEQLRGLADGLPSAWCGTLERVIDHVKAFRDHSDEFVKELRWSVQ